MRLVRAVPAACLIGANLFNHLVKHLAKSSKGLARIAAYRHGAAVLGLLITTSPCLAEIDNAQQEWAYSVNQAALLIAKKQYNQAESELVHSLAMAYASGALSAATVSELLLGDLYFSRSDYKNTERYYQMAATSPDDQDSIKGLKSLAAFYERLGKKEETNRCRVLQKRIEDKIAKEEKSGKRPADYKAYFDKMSIRINRFWTPPPSQQTHLVVAKFRLDTRGNLSLLHIAQSAGVKEADDAALHALTKAAPLPPPTPAFLRPLDMQYSFDPIKTVNPLKRNVPVKITRVGNEDIVDWPATEQAIQEAIDNGEKAKPYSPSTVVSLLLQLGDCYFEQKNNTDAESTYNRALKMCEKYDLADSLIIKCHTKLAEIANNQEKTASADREWRQVLNLVNTSKTLDKTAKIEYLSAYAKYLYTTSQTRDANAIYSRIRELQKMQ